MIITRSTSPMTTVPSAHEAAHAPVLDVQLQPLPPPQFVGPTGPISEALRSLVAPTPVLAPPVIALPSGTASTPAVAASMRAAVNSLASARPRLIASELAEIAADPAAQMAFANQLYLLQHTDARAARRVFGAMSSLVEGMSAAQREAIGPNFVARLVESTSFDGAPLQARALIEAFAGRAIDDAQWQQLLNASRPDPFGSVSGDVTGVGSTGTPDPAGFMRMFMTPRNANDDNTDPTGLGTVPPPHPGLSILLLVLAVLSHELR